MTYSCHLASGEQLFKGHFDTLEKALNRVEITFGSSNTVWIRPVDGTFLVFARHIETKGDLCQFLRLAVIYSHP